MSQLNWNTDGFTINGAPAYLVSGEFHYFRVPPQDWARRMRLFREAGGNCLATYVPWMIHEPVEGDIRFGDCPGRDLVRFLETAQSEGLMVILRPGPYQYSELVNDGLPLWLTENYPELLAKNIRGESFRSASVSYLHPLLLEKARRYFRAFADAARPFMASNGGPVCMVQVDNELMGIHLWFGSADYNPETMGFGKKDGRYALWLERRYGSVERLNAAYGCDFADFSCVRPIEPGTPHDIFESRRMRDYAEFYLSTTAEYAATLAGWLREDGIDAPLCHNSGNPSMNALFRETVERMGGGFLLGSDHYYALSPYWPQNNPTPQYMLRCLTSLELLRAMGMPPTVLELPAGNLSDTPPILKEDLYACYMANTAMGMKGLNYYIFTGGPNFPGTGATGAVYDYHAPISADGELRDTYGALKDFGLFLAENGWMQRAHRVSSVQLGFDWETSRFQEYAPPLGDVGMSDAWDLLEYGAEYSLLAGCCPPELRPLTGGLDLSRPLIAVCPSCMSRSAQQAVVDFVEAGGNVLLLPVLPEYDENGEPETLLRDYTGISGVRRISSPGAFVRVDGSGDVYMIQRLYTASLPADAVPIAWDERSGEVIGAEIKRGRGRMIWLGAQFRYQMFCEAAMMEALAMRLGAKPAVECSNRNVFTALWSDGERRMLFLINLHSAPQSTDIRVLHGEPAAFDGITLGAMEVKTILL